MCLLLRGHSDYLYQQCLTKQELFAATRGEKSASDVTETTASEILVELILLVVPSAE